MSTIQDIAFQKMGGATATLADYQGKVALIVNVASKCGLTPQYEALEKLYRLKKAEGLEILGFPANNFNGQEPGNDDEISSFCSLNYDVSFPLFSKISVSGNDQHPLYARLIEAQPQTTGDGPMRDKLKSFGIEHSNAPEVLWNFEKFLINKKGEVVGRFAPDITADDARIVDAIETELAK